MVFPPLPYIEEELEAIGKFFGGRRLMNREFLVDRVGRELREKKYTTVHIASHGQFFRKCSRYFSAGF